MSETVYEPTDDEWALARDWHGGQASMLYGIASTGSLSLGTMRPMGDDEPMTDDEWADHLLWKLVREVREIAEADTVDDHDEMVALGWLAKIDA